MDSNVTYLNDYVRNYLTPRWEEIFSSENEHCSCHIYMNFSTGELEIMQLDSTGKGTRTILSADEAKQLMKKVSKT